MNSEKVYQQKEKTDKRTTPEQVAGYFVAGAGGVTAAYFSKNGAGWFNEYLYYFVPLILGVIAQHLFNTKVQFDLWVLKIIGYLCIIAGLVPMIGVFLSIIILGDADYMEKKMVFYRTLGVIGLVFAIANIKLNILGTFGLHNFNEPIYNFIKINIDNFIGLF